MFPVRTVLSSGFFDARLGFLRPVSGVRGMQAKAVTVIGPAQAMYIVVVCVKSASQCEVAGGNARRKESDYPRVETAQRPEVEQSAVTSHSLSINAVEGKVQCDGSTPYIRDTDEGGYMGTCVCLPASAHHGRCSMPILRILSMV